MRVLFFTDSYFPQINGLVTSIDTVARALSQRHRIWVIFPRAVTGVRYKKPYFTMGLLSIPFLLFPEYRISFIFSFRVLVLLLKNRIDIIHTHTFFSLGIMGLVFAKIFKIPLVHTYHTFFEEYLHYIKLSKKIGRKIVSWISRLYCNQCDRIIVPTQMMKKVLWGYGVKKDIVVIPTGIPFKKYQQGDKRRLRKKMGIPLSSPVLLYVGRLAREKNIFFLLDCFREVCGQYNQVYLFLLGDGPLKKDVRQYIEKNKMDRIKLNGFVKQNELKDIYATGNIFIFSSLTETQGLVILEAMAAGLPVCAVAFRGTKYILPEKKIPGISPVNANKKEMIREIIYYLENYRKKHNLFKTNLKKYIQPFSIEHTTATLTDLYKSILRQ
ncbi:MAG: glycosyltransferase [Spirochaetes bacterium]|nr:glycosyltransferase [Spirochaetota bacterium]